MNSSITTVLGQSQTEGGPGAVVMLMILAISVVVIAGMWKTLAKAGLPGWGLFIPIYNIYLFCRLAGRPGWWTILCFIPIVSLIVWIIMTIDVAKNFGKGAGFALGLIFLGFVFYPILGFGRSAYMGSDTMAVEHSFIPQAPPTQPAGRPI